MLNKQSLFEFTTYISQEEEEVFEHVVVKSVLKTFSKLAL